VDGKYQQAVGTAIECRRLDKLEEAISRSDNVRGTLSWDILLYVFAICLPSNSRINLEIGLIDHI
jgi:hypothetical protein